MRKAVLYYYWMKKNSKKYPTRTLTLKRAWLSSRDRDRGRDTFLGGGDQKRRGEVPWWWRGWITSFYHHDNPPLPLKKKRERKTKRSRKWAHLICAQMRWSTRLLALAFWNSPQALISLHLCLVSLSSLVSLIYLFVYHLNWRLASLGRSSWVRERERVTNPDQNRHFTLLFYSSLNSFKT